MPRWGGEPPAAALLAAHPMRSFAFLFCAWRCAQEREHSSRRQAQVALVEVNAVTPIVRACEAAATTAAAQAELHQGTASSSEEALFGLKQALNDAQVR